MNNEYNLKEIRTLLLDLDGTFYLGDKLLPGSKNLVEYLRKTGRNYYFLSNNSSRTADEYVKKLQTLGIDVTEEKIYTSINATVNYLKHYYSDKGIYIMGTASVRKYFLGCGIKVREEPKDAEVIVVCFDTELTYEKLRQVCERIKELGFYIATHPDKICPLPNNHFMPDVGAFIALIASATEIHPIVIGKPSKYIIEMICKEKELAIDKIMMVGDRLYTDILLGENADCLTTLVLTGETTAEDYKTSKIKANILCKDLEELLLLLKKADRI